jgi:hypothetical protein
LIHLEAGSCRSKKFADQPVKRLCRGIKGGIIKLTEHTFPAGFSRVGLRPSLLRKLTT